MKIYTYFENINFNSQDKLVDLWKTSWSRHGYEPIVLNLEDAKKHPYFETLDSEMRKIFNIITGKQISKYGMSCWQRWLAYSMQPEEKFYVSDYDAININFPIIEPSDKLHLLDYDCPFFASGTPRQFERLCKAFVEVSNERIETLKLQATHYHDQEFFTYNLLPDNNSECEKYKNKYNILMSRDRYKIGGEIDSIENKILASPNIGFIETAEYGVVHISHSNIGSMKQKYNQYRDFEPGPLRLKIITELLSQL